MRGRRATALTGVPLTGRASTMAKLLLFSTLEKRGARAPALMRMMVGLEGWLMTLLSWFLGRLPADRASAMASRLFQAIGPRLAKHQKIERNLAIAFGDLGPVEIEALARRVWANAGAVIAEYPHLEIICRREADERLQAVVHDEVKALCEAGKPTVFVTAHLANWEVAAAAASRMGFPMMVVYTPFRNPRIDRMVKRLRGALGVKLVSRDQAMRPLTQHLRQGGSVGLVVDQRVDSGEPISFFGLDMWTTVMPARLALKFGAELVPVRVERLRGARFRATFLEPIRPDDRTADEQAQVLQMTRKVNALFESWIREHPDQWMCTKRRWPKRLTAGWLR